jgi:hypothetical protein
MDIQFLKGLEFAWTANVLLNNGQAVSIWYTALPMSSHTIKQVLCVASDIPKRKI